jgi:hypothetical protein
MNPAIFSLRVDFFTPKVFRISVAAELAPALLRRGSDSIAIPRLPPMQAASGFPRCSSCFG